MKQEQQRVYKEVGSRTSNVAGKALLTRGRITWLTKVYVRISLPKEQVAERPEKWYQPDEK